MDDGLDFGVKFSIPARFMGIPLGVRMKDTYWYLSAAQRDEGIELLTRKYKGFKVEQILNKGSSSPLPDPAPASIPEEVKTKVKKDLHKEGPIHTTYRCEHCFRDATLTLVAEKGESNEGELYHVCDKHEYLARMQSGWVEIK